MGAIRTIRHRLVAIGLLCIAATSLTHASGEPAPSSHKRILVLHFARPDAGAFAGIETPIHNTLVDTFGDSLEYSSEYLDLIRFDEPRFQSAMRAYLRARYAEVRFDAIIAASPAVLQFLEDDPSLFPHVPVVFMSRPGVAVAPNSTGVMSAVNFTESLAAALRLHPDTTNVFVVSGTSDFDRLYEAAFRSQAAAAAEGRTVTYLSGLPMPQLQERLRRLPPRSIVYYISVSADGTGDRFLPAEAVERLSAVANAPVYSWHQAMLGHGIVGGRVHSSIKDSEEVAKLAIRVLNGEEPSTIPVAHLDSDVYQFDWRQLARWRIPERVLPPGSVVLFRQYSFWDQYRSYVVAGLVIFAAQLALIVGLVVQRASRRRVEARLRNNEELYRSVVDTQSDLICRFHPDSTLTFVNDAYCRFWNRSREELLGRKFIEFIPPKVRDVVLEGIVRIRYGSDSQEHEVILPDGSVGWHHWVNHAIVDERGAIIEFQGVGRDITDYRRAEAALQQADERHTAMLRAIPDLMFVILRDGTYVDYNARDETLLFAPPSAFLGRTVRQIMPPALADVFMEAIERAFARDETVVVEYELQLEDTKYFEGRIVRAGADRVLSIVRDLTEAKRTAQLNRELAGRLIASQEAERRRIARELHDDLSQTTALLMMDIERLSKRYPQEQPRFLELSERAHEIAAGLHNLSYELHPSKLETLGLLSALKALCRDISQQGGVPIAFTHESIPGGVDPNVSLCLYRITQEALHNVARHSHATDAEVRLAADAQHLTLHIADSGVGFDARTSHAGLGLVSMRERAALLRGEMVVETFPGGGTRIGVRVPFKGGEKADVQPGSTARSRRRAPSQG
jgi:PAS domain S-box-containing protein